MKIIIVILLGAMGSGVWEYIIKPSFGSISEVTLNIITFGLESYKNNLYSEIALGFYEKTSWTNLSLLNSIYLMVGLSAILYIYGKVFDNKIDNYKETLFNMPTEEKKEAIENLIEINTKKLKKASLIVMVIIIIAISINQFTLFRLGYINKSIATYKQLINISKPYISNKELLLLESQFALIKTKNDYENIVIKLEKIIKNNNLTIQ